MLCKNLKDTYPGVEVRRLKNLVYKIDPKAFVFTNSIKEAAGGVLKRNRAVV